MSVRNKKLDMPYSQMDDVQEYVEAFDLETSEIDFNVIDEYKESPYALDASTLNSINDDINIMQNNWHEDIDETLDDKAELFQSWIDNLGEEVRPWNNVAIDKSPYLLRRSANGSLSYPFDREIDKIVGASVAWNQLQANTISRTNNGVTFTYSNGVVTASVGDTATNAAWWLPNDSQSVKWDWIPNHIYYIGLGNDMTGTSRWYIPFATTHYLFQRESLFKKTDNIETTYLQFNILAGFSGSISYKPQVIDLTALFGSAEIADYVYSLEQTTSGAGIAWLKSHFPKMFDTYHAYNTGSLLSVKTSEHKTTGKNLMPLPSSAVSEGITYTANSDGTMTVNGTSTGYSYVESYTTLPSGTYKVVGINDIADLYLQIRNRATDAYITNQWDNNGVFTLAQSTEVKCRIVVTVSGKSFSNYNAKPMVCLNSASDKSFEPYIAHTYPLDSDLELRGIPKLSNGSLYYDGDVYESSGAVTRKYGIVDLGTLTWSTPIVAGTQVKAFTQASIGGARTYGNGEMPNIIANGYVADTPNHVWTGANKRIAINTGGYIQIYDTAFTDYTGEQVKTAMSGVYLVYELATPTTEQADLYVNPQVVNPLGTEEYVDTRDVPIPVGHETRYLNNDLYYYKNDIVTYSEDVGAMFLCLQDCDGSQPLPTALTVANDYWLRVYDKGKPGLNVYNLTDKGKFNWQNNYVVNDVVWMDERHINFYVCISNVSYTINNTPNYDSAHWVKLFSVYRDGMPIYWEMPNQNFFNDAYSPSVFGVAQGTSLNFDSIDVLNNITNITEEDSSLRLLENETILLTIYKQDGNAYNSTPILHCGTLINVPLIESGVIYKIPLNFLFYNMHMGLLCIYEEGVGASFILAKLDNNDNVYYDIDGYIDENYFVYNKAQYESLFPNVPYIKIEFNKHASETPILIRLINRIQTQDINNPQYIKLKTSSDAIVKEDNIVLITLNDLINDLIEENNI